MFYRDRPIEEYETHQRGHSYIQDELGILVADAKVKRHGFAIGILNLLGNSIKERDDNLTSTTLVPLTRQRNETIFE